MKVWLVRCHAMYVCQYGSHCFLWNAKLTCLSLSYFGDVHIAWLASHLLSLPPSLSTLTPLTSSQSSHKLIPAQWVNCDIRILDMSCLGKFSVIMADPPWDIHMELPYGGRHTIIFQVYTIFEPIVKVTHGFCRR